MVKFDHDNRDLIEAFLAKECINGVNFIDRMIDYTNTHRSITQTVERIWIDETVTDNVKAFAIFSMGRLYQMRKKGGESD